LAATDILIFKISIYGSHLQCPQRLQRSVAATISPCILRVNDSKTVGESIDVAVQCFCAR